MARAVSIETLRAWLGEGGELALLDVREPGQFDAGHLLVAVPAPYSRLELDVARLVPNRAVRVVLCDQGDGVAGRAAARLARMGFTDLHLLAGPPEAWRQSGCEVFEGVNTMSKVFGELVEQSFRTPLLGPLEVKARIDRGESLLVVDGRPLGEYRRMSIPGSVCCPNGELALRIGSLAPDPATMIVVNCAGRTRSIIGAQSLRSLGIPNPVCALENGTQGWNLAGLALEHGASRVHGIGLTAEEDLKHLQARTSALMRRYDVPSIDAATLNRWRIDGGRTTYVFDVRTEAEFVADARAGVVHAPGGQLLQATDHWIGVRGARTALIDADGVRAGVIAVWLRQMGHDAVVLEHGGERDLALDDLPRADPASLPYVDFLALAGARVIDLRSSAEYRAGHSPGAIWSVRPQVVKAAEGADRVALLASDSAVAALAALELTEAGIEVLGIVANAPLTESSPDVPSRAASIDFAAFAHGRHDGNRAAALQYLRWETQLPGRLTQEERALFAVARRDPDVVVAPGHDRITEAHASVSQRIKT